MKKKFFVFILALTCAVSLGACSGGETQSTPGASASQAPVVQSAAPEPAEEQTAEAIQKSVDIELDGKQLSLSVDFPIELASFITLEAEGGAFGEGIDCASVFFAFSRGGQAANIGTVSVFAAEQYDLLDPEKEPIPSRLFDADGFTVAYQGLQSPPFDPASEEGRMIDDFQAQLQNILNSIVLNSK